MEDLEAKNSHSTKSQSTYQWAVRIGKIQEKLEWMLGKDTRVTCGDLTLISRNRDTMNLTQRQKSAES